MHFARFIHPEDLSAGRTLFLDLVDGNIERHEMHQRLIDKSGNIFLAKKRVSIVRGSGGAPKYIIRVVELVTESAAGGRHHASAGD